MSEAKTFASLSSGLLARKGAARPAMRPQGISGNFNSGIEDLGWNDMGHSADLKEVLKEAEIETFAEPHEEHVPSPISALTPMGPGYDRGEDFEPALPVVEQQRAAIEASFGQPEVDRIVLATKAKKPADETSAPEVTKEAEAVEPQPIRKTPTGVPQAITKNKAAFTLRLEAERHLKLRLACAVTGRSAQQLVTEALDELLKSKPEIAALAGQLPGKSH